MHLMRESWTDSRLDDFAVQTDRRFDEVDRRFDAVDAELQRLNGRFDDLNRTLLQVGGGVIVALIGLVVTQL
jgi:hypothetical protein